MPDFLACLGSARSIAGVFLCLFGLGGCASLVPQTMGLRDAWPPGVVTRAELRDVPFFPQQEYQCGPAALASVLVHSGVSVSPQDLVKQVYLPGREGSLQSEMLAAPRRHAQVSYPLAPHFDDLLREIAAGNPVLVLQDTGLGFITNWHYAVVIGFDYPAGELYLRSGETARLAVPFTVFEYTWRKSNYWAMVSLPPERIPATASESAYLAAVMAMDRVAEPGAAIVAYSTFLTRWPGNVGASIALGNRYHGQGRFALAESVLRRAFDRHPDSVPVTNNLAQTLSDMGRNEEALAIIESAGKSEQSPFAAALRDTHALVLQRLGRNH